MSNSNQGNKEKKMDQLPTIKQVTALILLNLSTKVENNEFTIIPKSVKKATKALKKQALEEMSITSETLSFRQALKHNARMKSSKTYRKHVNNS